MPPRPARTSASSPTSLSHPLASGRKSPAVVPAGSNAICTEIFCRSCACTWLYAPNAMAANAVNTWMMRFMPIPSCRQFQTGGLAHRPMTGTDRDVPRDDFSFGVGQQVEEKGAHHREHHDGNESARRVEGALRSQDDVAKPLLAGDELADDGTDQSEGRRRLECPE